MPAAAGLFDDRPVALPSRPPTQMTRHRIAQIAEKVNPKSPEIRPQEGRFLQNRLLHRPLWLTQRQSVGRSSRTTYVASATAYDLAHQLSAATRPADALLDRGACLGQGADSATALLASKVTVILQSFGAGQQS